MIPDWKTNCVYFSGLLPDRHPRLWEQLAGILRKHRIPVRLIDGTRDVWARDYYPVQVEPRGFVNFRYYPDYLHGYKHLITPGVICRQFQELGSCRQTRTILDGGNVVAAESRAILTRKIYRANPRQEPIRLRSKLEKLLQVDQCLVIPAETGDPIGHSDGVVRFLEEDLVAVNDYSSIDPAYERRLRDILMEEGLRIEKLPHFREDRSQDGIPYW
jgi:hypothetical protein